MGMLTALPWLQIITALTIPIVILAITHSRTSTDEPVRWRHVAMMIPLSALPATLLLGLRAFFSPLVVAGLFVVIIVTAAS